MSNDLTKIEPRLKTWRRRHILELQIVLSFFIVWPQPTRSTKSAIRILIAYANRQYISCTMKHYILTLEYQLFRLKEFLFVQGYILGGRRPRKQWEKFCSFFCYFFHFRYSCQLPPYYKCQLYVKLVANF